jgi:hypothetical protein
MRSLHVIEPIELAGDPCRREADVADAGGSASRTMAHSGELVAADTRSVVLSIYRLLGQQDEPPRR